MNLKSHITCEGLSTQPLPVSGFGLLNTTTHFPSIAPRAAVLWTYSRPCPDHNKRTPKETHLNVATCSVLPWRSLAALVLQPSEHAHAIQVMPENLKSLGLGVAKAHLNDDIGDQDNPRLLSRSPHPYHRQKWQLLEPSDRVIGRAASTILSPKPDNVRHDQFFASPSPGLAKDSPPSTDSGTEADDENYVKRLPAPRAQLHKGLRGRPEALSGSGTPILTPTIAEGDLDEFLLKNKGKSREEQRRRLADNARRRKELIRRGAEVMILSALGTLVLYNPTVRPLVIEKRSGKRA